MIYFGTGKLIETSDTQITPHIDSFYAIEDWNNTVVTRKNLVEQSIIKEEMGTQFKVRITTDNPVDEAAHLGWYIDLKPGEKIIFDSRLKRRQIMFSTILPKISKNCNETQDGWVMILDTKTGMPMSLPPADLNGDGVIDAKDIHSASATPASNDPAIGAMMLKTSAAPSSSTRNYTSGFALVDASVPMLPAAIFNDTKKQEDLYINTTGKGIHHILGSVESAPSGRKTWRQIN